MHFEPKNKKTTEYIQMRLDESMVSGNVSRKTLKNVIGGQKYSLKKFLNSVDLSVFPRSARVYKFVAGALIVTSLTLYVSEVNVAFFNAKKEADSLAAENSSLSDTVNDLDNALNETTEKLEETDKLYGDTKQELDETKDKLEASEKDSEEKQEIIDNMSSVEEEKREELEETIKDLIDTFGDANKSRSGAQLYSSLNKIDDAKEIISVYLVDNPKSEAYIKALNEEKALLEDRIKRYPDYEPAEGNISQYFGNHSYWVGNKLVNRYHNGLDIYNNDNVPIYSAAYGTVTEVQSVDKGGLGLYVKIDHGNGYETLYGHMSVINVKVGQTVQKGQRIGIMGETGAATGVHVHIEVFLNGNRTDPLKYMYPHLQ